jgi:hypothetical protein
VYIDCSNQRRKIAPSIAEDDCAEESRVITKLRAHYWRSPAVLTGLDVRPGLRKRLEKAAENFDVTTIEPIDGFEVADRTEAAPWLLLRHSGENEGKGIVDWSGVAGEFHTSCWIAATLPAFSESIKRPYADFSSLKEAALSGSTARMLLASVCAATSLPAHNIVTHAAFFRNFRTIRSLSLHSRLV